MAWAVGTAVQGMQLEGEFWTPGDGLHCVPLQSFATDGVPCDISAKQAVETDFATWSLGSPAEYLAAFEFRTHDLPEERHDVFAFQNGRTRILLPALVLLRALFRPKPYLLPAMFGPNAVENTCHLNLDESVPKLELDARWASRTSRIGCGEIAEPLLWMQCFPSAYAAAGSVHAMARSGTIGIQLPRATVSASLRGRRLGNTMFATEARIRTVVPLEPPYDFAQQHPGLVHFQRQFGTSSSALHRKELRSTIRAIPRQADGTVELTEVEWEAVAPILLAGADVKRQRLDQREIFNGLLVMLAEGKKWREADFGEARIANALYAYREWQRRGTLQNSLDALVGMRTP